MVMKHYPPEFRADAVTAAQLRRAAPSGWPLGRCQEAVRPAAAGGRLPRTGSPVGGDQVAVPPVRRLRRPPLRSGVDVVELTIGVQAGRVHPEPLAGIGGARLAAPVRSGAMFKRRRDRTHRGDATAV